LNLYLSNEILNDVLSLTSYDEFKKEFLAEE